MNKLCLINKAALIAASFFPSRLLPSAVVEECAAVGWEASTAAGWAAVSEEVGWVVVSAGAQSAVAFGERP